MGNVYWTKSENVLFYSGNHNAVNVVFKCTTHELDLIRLTAPIFPLRQKPLFLLASNTVCSITHRSQAAFIITSFGRTVRTCRVPACAGASILEIGSGLRCIGGTHTGRSKVVQQLLNLAVMDPANGGDKSLLVDESLCIQPPRDQPRKGER
jgi:hypothetical protein